MMPAMNEASAETVSVRRVQVAEEGHGQRVDNYLHRLLKGVPRSLIYRILRTGEVRVNRDRVGPKHRLAKGDELRIPPLRVGPRESEVTIPANIGEQLRRAELFRDRDLLIIDKPAGLAVHKGSGLSFGLIEALRQLNPDEPFLELAHRLDRDTSGCLVLARNPQALRAIQAALRAGSVDKRYLVLVRGRWQGGEVAVDVPLRKGALKGGERMVLVRADGKPARTLFRELSQLRGATLLEAVIDTGRTHQIRVHAAHLGYPLAGDSKYGDARFNRELATSAGLHRLFLHAHTVEFAVDGRMLSASSPLPDDLRRVVDALEPHP